MAEGLARATAPPDWQVFSAGSKPSRLNPRAVEAMAEVGIDIGDHRSKGLDEIPIESADFVVTLCAEEECPVAYTSGVRLAWPHPDPAAPQPTVAAEREAFRSVRDMIEERVERFWREQEEH
jgi:protein-tyrosine-phosphatase